MWALRSALWAIQAGSWQRLRWRQPRECVEMTPPGRRRSPLLTLAGKWSSSSGTINGDRSLRGSGGWCGGGAAGRRGPRSNNTQTSKGEQQHGGVTWTYNPYREIPLWATSTTKEAHSPHGVTPHHNSLYTSHNTTGGGGWGVVVSNKWSACIHTIGSHNHTVGHTITQPVHPLTGPHTTTDDPTLDTHITRTQNES